MFYDDDGNEDTPTTERVPVFLIHPFLNEGTILFTQVLHLLNAAIMDIFFRFLNTSFTQNNETAFYVGYYKENIHSFNVQCTLQKQ